MLSKLQSTLINRNIRNLPFLASLIKYCHLSSPESEDLALKIIKCFPAMNYSSDRLYVIEIIKTLFSQLSIQTMRICILSCAGTSHWINLMSGNISFLYNRKIEEDKNDKAQNFHMNDGDNVQIPNTLGVLLL